MQAVAPVHSLAHRKSKWDRSALRASLRGQKQAQVTLHQGTNS
jgi:hypothetical protein